MFTYTTSQADVMLARGVLAFNPWLFYVRRADSSLSEFVIDNQGTHAALVSHDDCAGHWSIVIIGKCELQARLHSPHAWRDHRLRLIHQCGIPY